MTYSLTPQDIADRIQGFSLNGTAVRPDATTLASIIEESAAIVNQYLVGKGISVPKNGTPAFLVARSAVVDLAVSKAELARNRAATSMVNETYERVQKVLDTISTTPGFIDEGPSTRMANVGSRGRVGSKCRPPSISDRMAREGKL